ELVYLELFSTFNVNPAPSHLLHTTSHAGPTRDRQYLVVPIEDVVLGCHLAPNFRHVGRNIQLDSHVDLLSDTRHFFFNHYYNLYTFQLMQYWRHLRLVGAEDPSFPDETKLTEDTPNGFFLIADTAFLTNTPELAEKIHTPLKQGSRLPADRDERVAAIEYSNRLTQARQAVEWGMRALQSVFSRLRVPMDINDPEGREQLLEVCTRLHNLWTRCVGINGIRSVYMPEPDSAEAALRQQAYSILFPRTQIHDRIGQFYLDDDDE
ncbi:hypothetical protein FRC07_009202, partial [Ceratobasidium sp. 392]